MLESHVLSYCISRDIKFLRQTFGYLFLECSVIVCRISRDSNILIAFVKIQEKHCVSRTLRVGTNPNEWQFWGKNVKYNSESTRMWYIFEECVTSFATDSLLFTSINSRKLIRTFYSCCINKKTLFWFFMWFLVILTSSIPFKIIYDSHSLESLVSFFVL